MKKVIIILAIISILLFMLISLTGCSITAETSENSVSVSVDEDTQNTFDNIVDWIVERLHRVFVTENSEKTDGGSDTSEVI
ncbi:MAG: hypothetical protein K1W33_05680 [Clostridia bacterium]|nr:hypothetical protein [Clostridia bacterium]